MFIGISVAAGALLVRPDAPRALAAPTVGGDENGPKVQIIAPAYQDVLKGRARILVGVRATQYNPATIQLFLDDQPASNVLPLSSLASSSFDWDTRATPDGPHRLSVRVTDTQGFRGWTEVNVYINNAGTRDTTPPDLKWKNVQSFQQLSGTARLELGAKDNFGVKWIIVSLNPIEKADKQPAQRSWLLSRPPYAFDLDTTKVADGLYALSARAWDSMEQEGHSPMLTVGVVNAPVNATTVGESLDNLRARAASEGKSTRAVPKAENVPASVNLPPAPRVAKALPDTGASSATRSAAVLKLPPGYKLILPKTVASGARVTHPTTVDNTAQTLGKVALPALTPRTVPGAPAQAKPATQIARAEKPVEVAPPTLSAPAPNVRAVQTAPAAAQTVPLAAKETVAPRLTTPRIAARPELTAPDTATDTPGVVSPAHAPDIEAPDLSTTRLEVARLTQPKEKTGARELEVEPILSSQNTSLAGAISAARVLAPVAAPAEPLPVALLASAPDTTPRVMPRRAKVQERPRYERTPHTVAKIAAKTAPVVGKPVAQTPLLPLPPMEIAPPVVTAKAPEKAPVAPPVLSERRTQRDGVRAGVAPLSKTAPRMARLPQIGTPDARAVEVAPSVGTTIQPAITVSPVRVAFNSSLPAYHQVRHHTTLRAVAQHYGLPVELVAAANNWTTDMRVIPGMKVQLPRQVQLSFNGQRVRGDVASLLAGDTSFTAMRFLFEHTGGTIKWDAAKQEVVARKGNSTIRVTVGSKWASVNHKQVMMQLAAFIFEGRTMVPTRFFEQGLDAHVDWNPETGHLVVAMAG